MAEATSVVVRVWLPDRPGALGQVASRIGAVQGDVVGIDILERGAGRAVDELVVSLPSADLVPLLVSEIGEVDGVDVEDVRLLDDPGHDPRVDALETAALLVGASSLDDLLEALCEHGARVLGATWVAVVQPAPGEILHAVGPVPAAAWLTAFVEGSRSADAVHHAVDDVVWAPLPGSGLALVSGRDGTAFRARERRQAAALGRIVDTRVRELAAMSRAHHPATRSSARAFPAA
jgi:hypothetical protein